MTIEMKQLIGAIIIFCVFISCQEKRIEIALDLAGPNRQELEAVLEHYKDDPEKQAAARFLIENMPHWYGHEGLPMDSLLPVLEAGAREKYIPEETIDKWKDVPFYSTPKVSDIKNITANYLIENIDLAIKAYKERAWNRNLPFEDFCELILPYRIEDEPLANWRKMYYEYYSHLLDSLYPGGTDVVEACNVIAKDLKEKGYHYVTQFTMPHLPADFLFNHCVGSCRELCDVTLYAMRACGIPVAIDEFIYSPEYQHGHTWCVVRDTTGRYLPFSFEAFEARRDMKDDGRKKGKVYRSYFGVQKEFLKGITKRQDIPSLFQNLYKKDVTINYIRENSIQVPVADIDEEFVYLGVFSPNGWIPIDITRKEGKRAVFRNVEPDIIYQPLFSDGNEHRPAGYPFIYTNDILHLLKPFMNKKEKVDLYRKMSLVGGFKLFGHRNIIGAKIEGSKDRLFREPILLYEFKDTLKTNYYKFVIKLTDSVRYVRFVSPVDRQIELAELGFYKDTLLNEPVDTMIRINTLPLVAHESMFSNITDGDVLSYFYSRDTTCFIAYDLQKKLYDKGNPFFSS